MQTLTYGLKLPETGDQGTTLFTALEDNISQLDAHDHDGVNSPLLTPQSMPGIEQEILAASWVAHGPTGHYRQQVTVPAGFDFDTVSISFRTDAGAIIYPTVEKVSATQYYVYTIDNTIDFNAVYG